MPTIVDISGDPEAQNWLAIGRLRSTKGKIKEQIKKDQAQLAQMLADQEDDGALLSSEQVCDILYGGHS